MNKKTKPSLTPINETEHKVIVAFSETGEFMGAEGTTETAEISFSKMMRSSNKRFEESIKNLHTKIDTLIEMNK